MRVAIDAGPLKSGHRVRGIGAHTRELIGALGKKVIPLDFSSQKSKLKTGKFDLLHYTSFHPFFLSLPWRRPKETKIVLTIHDLIPLVYPKHYPGGIKGGVRFLVNKFLIKKNVDAIITISETSKKDICRFLGVSPDKVYVVYLAPRKIFRRLEKEETEKIRRKYHLPEKFVLYVGDVNYNKNIPNLLKACQLAKTPLVICGKQALEIETLGKEDLSMLEGPKDWLRYLFGKSHPELAHFKDLAHEFKNNKKIIRLGFVPDEELVAIYNLAAFYVQPSFYEGFGLPVLEALASGCPVVCAKTQALVEIAEGAAVFVDPNDPKDFVRGFNRLVKIPKLPRDYGWKKVARETLQVYEKI